MKYAIHAYEDLYGGLCGVYTDFVVDVKSPVEAQEMANTRKRVTGSFWIDQD